MRPFEDILEEFLSDRGYRPATRNSYTRWLLRIAAEFPQALDEPHGSAWSEPGQTKRAFLEWFEELPLDEARKKQMFYALRAFLRWRYGTHPLLSLRRRFPDKPPPIREFDEDAAVRLLRSFDLATPRGVRDFALAVLWMDTGLRVAEMSRLTLANLNLPQRALTVEAKGGRWRRAVFSQEVQHALRQWLDVRAHIARPQVESVFVSLGAHRGKGLTREGLKVIVRKWGKQLGIRLGTHDFRRLFATVAARNGASEQIIAKAGGWASTAMIRRYTAALVPEDIEPYSPARSLIAKIKD